MLVFVLILVVKESLWTNFKFLSLLLTLEFLLTRGVVMG